MPTAPPPPASSSPPNATPSSPRPTNNSSSTPTPAPKNKSSSKTAATAPNPIAPPPPKSPPPAPGSSHHHKPTPKAHPLRGVGTMCAHFFQNPQPKPKKSFVFFVFICGSFPSSPECYALRERPDRTRPSTFLIPSQPRRRSNSPRFIFAQS
jgi:hypothetical protein